MSATTTTHLILICFGAILIHHTHGLPASKLSEEAVASSGSQLDGIPSGNQSSQAISHEREFPGIKVQTECKRDKTVVRVNFSRPFNGLMAIGKLDKTKCKLLGSGGKFYEIKVRHSQAGDCDTLWDNSTSSLISSFSIRQHLHLETGNDISMTVMCKLSVGDLVVGPARRSKSKKERIISGERPTR